MHFQLSEDQTTLMTAIDGLAARFAQKPTEFHGFALVSSELEQEIEANGFYDIAAIPDLGPLAAAMAVDRLTVLPFTAEIALSMLVRPHIGDGTLPRPFAIVEEGRPGRFVASAKTLLVLDGDQVAVVHPTPDHVEAVDSIFAYPMGRIVAGIGGTVLSKQEAATARNWIRVALAAEMSGLMQAGIATTVEHLSVRKQFGRPLGAFQALRHRMAECTVLAGGVRWLALKAAATGDPGDAALAAFHAQESASRIVYELHQMLGAMGMTLEHPLHLWTYRMKALLSELGGRSHQARAVGEFCFGAPSAR
jgi:hypothetical protein